MVRRPRKGGGRKSAGSSEARAAVAVAAGAAAVQEGSPKHRRINNLPWGAGLFL